MYNIKSKAWKSYFRKPLQFSAGKVLVDQDITADGDALSCDGRFNGMELFLETQAHCVCKAWYIVVSYHCLSFSPLPGWGFSVPWWPSDFNAGKICELCRLHKFGMTANERRAADHMEGVVEQFTCHAVGGSGSRVAYRHVRAACAEIKNIISTDDIEGNVRVRLPPERQFWQ